MKLCIYICAEFIMRIFFFQHYFSSDDGDSTVSSVLSTENDSEAAERERLAKVELNARIFVHLTHVCFLPEYIPNLALPYLTLPYLPWCRTKYGRRLASLKRKPAGLDRQRNTLKKNRRRLS